MRFTFLQCFNDRKLKTFLNLLLREETMKAIKKKSPETIKQELIASVMKIIQC